MLLRITIEPDGSVSACKTQSSELKEPGLEDKIVACGKEIKSVPKRA
jgi:hypothetical protein